MARGVVAGESRSGSATSTTLGCWQTYFVDKKKIGKQLKIMKKKGHN